MKKIKELWAIPRYKALIKLSGWFIFFLLIIILCSLPTNTNNIKTDDKSKENEIEYVEYETMKNNLLSNNYRYTLTLTNFAEQSLIVYNGEINDGIDNGYYESKTEIYKYSCTLENCYKVYTDHQEEFEMENYPLSYIIFVFDLIKDDEPDILEENNTRNYKYIIDIEEDDWEVEIKTSLNDITNINLKTQKENYEIELEK